MPVKGQESGVAVCMLEVLLMMNTRGILHLTFQYKNTTLEIHLPRSRAIKSLQVPQGAVQDTYKRFLHSSAFQPVILHAVCWHPGKTIPKQASVRADFSSLPTLCQWQDKETANSR